MILNGLFSLKLFTEAILAAVKNIVRTHIFADNVLRYYCTDSIAGRTLALVREVKQRPLVAIAGKV